MPKIESIKQYSFPWPNDDKGYDIFPIELESNPNVVFHGTAESNLESILEDGFIYRNESPSISFAKNSSLSLRYACEKRSGYSPNGVVLAVIFESLQQPGLAVESSCIYLYPKGKQPKIIGYCVVPGNYLHI